MIALDRHTSLGSALDEALERWGPRVCLIESDREREKERLTYADFAARGRTLAQALAEHGFAAGSRAAIVMSNQSKWLLSAYAVFRRGGVLVPLDFKLSAAEHLQLLAHARAQVLVTEFAFWRTLVRARSDAAAKTPDRTSLAASAPFPALVLVTEAPPGADLQGARRWEEFQRDVPADAVPRQRTDLACIVYSSGTGGRPKGCMLTHDNYLEQCKALTQLYRFGPGDRYLSILPTNHAIDFMVGFFGPFVCGASVVHLRIMRPEFVRDAFPRYRITHMALVPLVLKNLERGLRQRLEALPPPRRAVLHTLVRLHRALVGGRPKVWLSRRLLAPIHRSFGGSLEMFFVGGAFTEPETLQFFFDLGIPVANGYGLTEAGTVLAVNDMRPFRADSVGKPLPGTELRILSPDADGIGEVAARGRTVMSGYLDDPELTSATIVDGWLLTGDLGRIDASGHLQLFGRKKNMIVTAGGKNIYPEDIENAFVGIVAKEYCVFAANYLWPQRSLANERLVMVLRFEPGQEMTPELQRQLEERNRRLPDFKRIHAFTVWGQDFPRTASMKVKREELAASLRARLARDEALVEL
ncbi:MAG TPA: AMP-binding protein [Candidatus Krumholzibacteria bacterium]|nr:AMP-binding protein [Candidatus Krumholzibacteria bacterium]